MEAGQLVVVDETGGPAGALGPFAQLDRQAGFAGDHPGRSGSAPRCRFGRPSQRATFQRLQLLLPADQVCGAQLGHQQLAQIA